MANRQTSYVSVYIIVAALIGAAVGLAFGALFDGAIAGRRTLAVLSALAALATEYAGRRFLAGSLPDIFAHKAPAAAPSLIFAAIVIALAGGLATHDLGLIWNVTGGAVLGAFAGLFAGLMAAVLITLIDAEARERRDRRS